ncbi:MAG: dihydroorotate dehydrogenase [Anaerolineae bacterium]
MDVELTRPGKYSLIVHSPVMPAAGTFGYGNRYVRLIKTEKFGAIVTDPITLRPRRVAQGPNSVPLPGGLLLHTGMPNPGVEKVIKKYRQNWANAPVPIIVHLMDRQSGDLRQCVRALIGITGVAGFELGIHEQASLEEIYSLINTVIHLTQLPLLVRVPLERAIELAPAIAQTEAGALVVGAPPRGIARDPVTGRLVRGRLYGPLVMPQALNTVAQVVDRLKETDLPVIAAGGIHTPDDARTFIEVGARAVQLDSLIWTRPLQAEIIARDLGGLQLTRETGALPDEWFPGIGDTHKKHSLTEPPDTLPE